MRLPRLRLTALVCVLAAVLASVLAACGSTHGGGLSAQSAAAPRTAASGSPTSLSSPAVPGTRFDHVIVVMLENEDEEDAFNRSAKTHYLSVTLPDQGALVTNYYGIGHNSLDNYLAIISGQAPNKATQADCPTLTVNKGTKIVSPGQLKGTGCIYPKKVKTLANQLEKAGLSWGEYAQDMAVASGAGVVNASKNACVHPAYGKRDTLFAATKQSQYATRHNPWVYFKAISAQDCVEHDVDLSKLKGALAHPATFPNVAMITPDLCNDGHNATCADGTSQGGMTQVNTFLKTYIPLIKTSATYRQGRTMIVVTFDEAEDNVSSACCGEKPGPNVAKPGKLGPGGGKIGAVVISPDTKPGTYPWQSYNHYGLLATIEKNFGLPRLGYAQGARPFGSDIFNR